MIQNGELSKAVGGGISQFATTMFNAVFFAGLEDVYHKPHSFYISRYPAGREATVYEGAIDLQWRNDSDTGVYIDTPWTPATITVTFYGTKRYEIEAIEGPAATSASRPSRRRSTTELTPQAGVPGFDITVTRVFRDLRRARRSGGRTSRPTTRRGDHPLHPAEPRRCSRRPAAERRAGVTPSPPATLRASAAVHTERVSTVLPRCPPARAGCDGGPGRGPRSHRGRCGHRTGLAAWPLPAAVPDRWCLGHTLAKAWQDRILGLSGEAAFWQILSVPPLLIGLLGSLGYLGPVIGGDGRSARSRTGC